MRRTKTFEIEYNYFEPGTIVTPTSKRCPLDAGETYVVSECSGPLEGDQDAIVFVDGHKFGFWSTYLREATPEEIEAGKWEVDW
jgi:hypothetical protein